MNIADNVVFGSSKINANGWEYGVTDLINFHVESDSRVVNPTIQNCIDLKQTIINNKPKVVVLLHSKVIKRFVKDFLGKENVKYGNLGKLVDESDRFSSMSLFLMAMPLPPKRRLNFTNR